MLVAYVQGKLGWWILSHWKNVLHGGEGEKWLVVHPWRKGVCGALGRIDQHPRP